MDPPSLNSSWAPSGTQSFWELTLSLYQGWRSAVIFKCPFPSLGLFVPAQCLCSLQPCLVLVELLLLAASKHRQIRNVRVPPKRTLLDSHLQRPAFVQYAPPMCLLLCIYIYTKELRIVYKLPSHIRHLAIKGSLTFFSPLSPVLFCFVLRWRV